MKMKILFLALVAVIITSSCTLKQSIDFNKDMSGTNTLSVDYSEFYETMSIMSPDSDITSLGSEMNMDEAMDELKNTFKTIEGVSNIKNLTTSSKSMFGFGFDFKDVKALNAAMVSYLEDGSEKTDKANLFSQKKKSIKVDFDYTSLNSLKESMGSDEMTGMFGASFEYELDLNFPFPIKKVDNDLYTISADRKNLNAKLSLSDLIEGKQNLNTKITW